MDVGEWLRGLGLGQYEATFRDNGIDGMVLPHLTVEDLRELGVAGVGDRRRLLHQSNARPVEAHSVLAPALKGLSATPEMPEFSEAKDLLVALAHRRNGSARRE